MYCLGYLIFAIYCLLIWRVSIWVHRYIVCVYACIIEFALQLSWFKTGNCCWHHLLISPAGFVIILFELDHWSLHLLIYISLLYHHFMFTRGMHLNVSFIYTLVVRSQARVFLVAVLCYQHADSVHLPVVFTALYFYVYLL